MNYDKTFSVTKQHNKQFTFNILIVDDDINGANLFGIILSKRGHHIHFAYNGITCISLCKNNDVKYDIIFIDYHMSDIDGAQVTDIIKSNNRHAIIFAYTGDCSDSSIMAFKKVKMAGALIKPLKKSYIDMLMFELETKSKIDIDIILSIKYASDESIIIFKEINLNF